MILRSIKNIAFTSFLIVFCVNCSTKVEDDMFIGVPASAQHHIMPTWSQDGNYIYYVISTMEHNEQDTTKKPGIYRIKPDGTENEMLIELQRLTDYIGGLQISPDNEWLAFSLESQIYKYSTKTASLVQLTFEGINFSPSWKPDGSRLVFSSSYESDSHYVLRTIDSDGSNIKKIFNTPDSGYLRNPFWGDFIYHTRRGGVFKIDEDGLNVRLITSSSVDNDNVKYNAKTGSLIFTINGLVWTANSEGGNKKQLTDKSEILYPSWSPDGEQIVYTNASPQNGYLWIMDKDGKNRRQLTD